MSKLEPGLELDKMIAEKVLGWHRSKNILGWYEDQKIKLYRFNRFSTDIEAAWDLVEKFKLCVMPWDDGQWTAVRLTEILEDGDRNKAPTAPHAICLAALFYANEGDE